MKTKKEKEVRLAKQENIQFINQAEEKGEIYLFKSAKDAEFGMSKVNENQQAKEKSIAVTNDSNSKEFFDELMDLVNTYKTVILFEYENNFSTDEISRIGWNAGGTISQTSDKTCNGEIKENRIAEIASNIGDPQKYTIGKEYPLYSNYLEKKDETIISYKNAFFKILKASKSLNGVVFTRLTNYSFRIVEIKVHADSDTQMQDLKLEVTDFNSKVKHIQIPAKDKYSLAGFKKNLYPLGNLLDCMSDTDFKQILNQLYSANNYKTVYQYDRPGLISDKNVWLLADEVINLEN